MSWSWYVGALPRVEPPNGVPEVILSAFGSISASKSRFLLPLYLPYT